MGLLSRGSQVGKFGPQLANLSIIKCGASRVRRVRSSFSRNRPVNVKSQYSPYVAKTIPERDTNHSHQGFGGRCTGYVTRGENFAKETSMSGKTMYVTVLFHTGDPTWFVLDPPPTSGFPQATIRMKVGTRHYFLTAAPPVLDAETGTILIVLQVQTHHAFWGNSVTPDGKEYQLSRVDRSDFENDPNWHAVENPFEGLAVLAPLGEAAATPDAPRRDISRV
jgi:hypothetical protein